MQDQSAEVEHGAVQAVARAVAQAVLDLEVAASGVLVSVPEQVAEMTVGHSRFHFHFRAVVEAGLARWMHPLGLAAAVLVAAAALYVHDTYALV